MRRLSVLGLSVAALSAATPGPLASQGSGPQVEELFRLGGVDAPPEEQFSSQLLSLSLGRNDQLLVLDAVAARIQVFSAVDGRHVRTIARSGQGPGEIGPGIAVGWDAAHHLWISDPANHRFSVFDSTGTFVRTVPRPPSDYPRRTGRLEFDREGRLVETALRGSRPYLRVIDPVTGEVVTEYAALPFEAPAAAMDQRAFLGLPKELRETVTRFQPWLAWDWEPTGEVWFSREDEYRVIVINATGDTLRMMDGPTRREFTPAEEDLVRQVRHRAGSDGIHLAPAQVQSMIRLDDGRLLVQRPEEMNEPGRVFDILSRSGDKLGEITLPLSIWPQAGVATGGDHLFVVGRGPLDVPVVLGLLLER